MENVEDLIFEPANYTFAELLRGLPDSKIRVPLWNFRPEDRPAVLSERRRRFGAPDDEVGDPEYA